jgi:hypothetical protein
MGGGRKQAAAATESLMIYNCNRRKSSGWRIRPRKMISSHTPFSDAPALHTAIDTAKIAFAPRFPCPKDICVQILYSFVRSCDAKS